jgi:hypothetical protein
MVSSTLDLINYNIVPPVFIIFFTVATQYLSFNGNPTRQFETWFIFGNSFAWKCIGSMISWALIWLWVPSKKFRGPITSFGYTPVYQV